MIRIKSREDFQTFKTKFQTEKHPISEMKETDSGFEIVINKEKYHLPPNCRNWLQENAPKAPYANDLIFGKDKTENVVSVGVKDSKIYIYTEDENGVNCEIRPFTYWIMSNELPSGKFTKLDGNLHYRYLKEFNTKKSYSIANSKLWKMRADKYSCQPEESYLIKNGLTYFKGMKVTDVSILSFDIETTGLDPEKCETLMISNTFRKNGKLTRKLFAIDEYKNELCMLYAWSAWVREMDPSIMVGHNIYSFDLYFLHRRTLICEKTQITEGEGYHKGLPLGRDGSVLELNPRPSEKRIPGGTTISYHKVSLFGREVIDTWFVAMDYDIGKEFESYGLKPIIQHLGLEKEDRIKWDFDKDPVRDLWKTDPKKWAEFKKYCIDDSDDSLKLFDLMIPARFYLSQSIPKPFQMVCETASGGQINSFLIRGYLQEGHSIPKPSDKATFEGAISYGQPGIYKNVYKLDVASLYPSIMRQWNIFDKKKDPLELFPKMVEYFTIQRLEDKRIANETGDQYYRDLEQSRKILINSAYGFMGASGLHFNSPENAALVTRKGREILTKAVEWASGYKFEKAVKKETKTKTEYHWVLENKTCEGQGMLIPNVDTDSFSFSYEDGRKLSPEEFQKVNDQVNDLFPELITWEDDGYFDTFVVLAAKNYIMKQNGEMKIKGSSLRDAKKEIAMQEMMRKICEVLSE